MDSAFPSMMEKIHPDAIKRSSHASSANEASENAESAGTRSGQTPSTPTSSKKRNSGIPSGNSAEKKKARLWILAGWACLGLAFVGLALPIIPQVPFAFAAAFCFSRGSPRLHRWLRSNKHFGPTVRDWEDERVLKPKLKIISTIAMLFGGALAYFKLQEEHPIAAIVVPILFLAAIVYVVTRQSRPQRQVPALPSEFAYNAAKFEADLEHRTLH